MEECKISGGMINDLFKLSIIQLGPDALIVDYNFVSEVFQKKKKTRLGSSKHDFDFLKMLNLIHKFVFSSKNNNLF